MRNIIRTAATTVLAGAAGLALVLPATSAGAAQPPRSVTGREVITGTLVQPAKVTTTIVPVRARGVFDARGFINLGGKGGPGNGFVVFRDGKLSVHHSAGKRGHAHITKSCVFTQTSTGTFKVLPNGTGRYRGASGSGDYAVTFVATLPRTKGGACNNSSMAQPIGKVKVAFVAIGKITLR